MDVKKLLDVTTPSELTDFVISSAAKLSDHTPVFVDYEYRRGSVAQRCFPNVKAAVAEDGGEVVYGWMIWEIKNALIEAEHHAVWRKPDGSLVDITPKADGEKRILFVQDNSAVYSGKFIDMKRFAALGNPLARDFIKAKGDVDKLIEPWRLVGRYTVPPDVMAKAGPKDRKAMKLYRKLREGKTR